MDAAKSLGKLQQGQQAPEEGEEFRLWGIGEKMHEFTFIFPLLGCIGAGNKLTYYKPCDLE